MDLDRTLFPVEPEVVKDRPHVFVSGLARAGTTILMRQLHGTGLFRSLTYRDMPFVLAPNLWARITGRAQQKGAARMRAHGDGIAVDYDSPEALEEVFWRVSCAERYIRPDRLSPMQIPAEEGAAFQKYVAAILRDAPATRYLSKNNNNILRLPDLARLFPNAVILVPLRDPLQHATSLLRQHRSFLQRHAEDGFSLKYMTWLAHHEFGADHRPFVFDAAARPTGDPAEDLGYWLEMWRDVYQHLEATAPASAVFVCYETLCSETDRVWPALCQHLGLPVNAPTETLRSAPAQAAPEGIDPALLQGCRALYDHLRAQAI